MADGYDLYSIIDFKDLFKGLDFLSQFDSDCKNEGLQARKKGAEKQEAGGFFKDRKLDSHD